MGTITAPTAAMLQVVREWERIYPSAVFSGINGDAAHYTAPGKHLSRSINRDKFGAGCWPIEHPKDKLGPNDKSCAIDVSMNKRDMSLCTLRLELVWAHRKTDWRAAYIYAFNGWKGSGNATRWNLPYGSKSFATPDHKWHVHGEGFYAYVNSQLMVNAWVSALKGEPANKKEEEDVPLTPADVKMVTDAMYARKWKEYFDQNGDGVRDYRTLPDLAFSTHAQVYRSAVEQRLANAAILEKLSSKADSEAVLARIDALAKEIGDARLANEDQVRRLVEEGLLSGGDPASALREIGKLLDSGA